MKLKYIFFNFNVNINSNMRIIISLTKYLFLSEMIRNYINHTLLLPDINDTV